MRERDIDCFLATGEVSPSLGATPTGLDLARKRLASEVEARLRGRHLAAGSVPQAKPPLVQLAAVIDAYVAPGDRGDVRAAIEASVIYPTREWLDGALADGCTPIEVVWHAANLCLATHGQAFMTPPTSCDPLEVRGRLLFTARTQSSIVNPLVEHFVRRRPDGWSRGAQWHGAVSKPARDLAGGTDWMIFARLCGIYGGLLSRADGTKPRDVERVLFVHESELPDDIGDDRDIAIDILFQAIRAKSWRTLLHRFHGEKTRR